MLEFALFFTFNWFILYMHRYHLQHPLNEGNLEITYYIIQGRLHIETWVFTGRPWPRKKIIIYKIL